MDASMICQPPGLLGAQHLLRALGVRMEGMLERLSETGGGGEGLGELADSFGRCGGITPQALGALLSSGSVPCAGAVPPPNAGNCRCPQGYAPPQQLDLGASPQDAGVFERLSNRFQAASFERFLQQNPFVRQQVEMMLGGKILPDGRADGRLTVQPFPPGHVPGAGAGQGGEAIQAIAGALSDLARGARSGAGAPGAGAPGAGGPGAGGQPGGAGEGQNLLGLMILGALAQLLGAAGAGGPGGAAGAGQGGGAAPGAGPGGAGGAGSPGGAGAPGGGAAPAGGAGGAGDGVEENAIMNDSSLSVEDKVMLLLMAVMKKMDKEIEQQMQHINKMQQQQKSPGGGTQLGKMGGGGPGGGSSDSSTDVETQKLQRLIQKRSQMFEMCGKIMQKYDDTAKTVLQNMGR